MEKRRSEVDIEDQGSSLGKPNEISSFSDACPAMRFETDLLVQKYVVMIGSVYRQCTVF